MRAFEECGECPTISGLASMNSLSHLEKITLPTAASSSQVQATTNSRKRLLAPESMTSSTYHVMSRTAGGEMVFGDVEKEAFRRLIWRLAEFSGVRVLTYAVMGNHFHLLVSVPNRESFLSQFAGPAGEEKLLDRLSRLYSADYIAQLQRELEGFRNRGLPEAAEALLGKYYNRFCNLSLFVKELKERFSRWFNKKEGRRGTLWMERFKSVLVEDGDALHAIAAYIDLNPTRAGLVEDPKDYRWCGYGESVAGSKRARRGLCRIMGQALDTWDTPPSGGAAAVTPAMTYRRWLLGVDPACPETKGSLSPAQPRKPAKEVPREVKVEKGQGPSERLTLAQLLRCKVRYFSDGLAIGSQGYVDAVVAHHREHFGPKRKHGGQPIRELEHHDAASSLCSIRKLRVRAVE